MTDQTTPPLNQWKTLDKDLARFSQLEAATATLGRPVIATGVALIFVVICALATFVLAGHHSRNLIIVGGMMGAGIAAAGLAR